VGRPALYATTRQFLDDLGVESLDQLPAMDGSAGQLAMLEQIEFGMPDAAIPEDVEQTQDSAAPAEMDAEAGPVMGLTSSGGSLVQGNEPADVAVETLSSGDPLVGDADARQTNE
jgi:segregation and condensation protein B